MTAEGLLWVDKHRPSTFSDLTHHPDLTERLRHLCTKQDVPHMLLYGPSGGGKRTRAQCILRALFGPTVEKTRIQHRVFRTDAGKSIEVTTVASGHHVEVNPSESGINDRLVVQELLKDMASSAPIDTARKMKVIILHEVDRMSRLAQQALRRTMERFSRTCRIIMIAESATRVLEPLRSRCLGVRVGLPPRKDLCTVLRGIAGDEGLTLPDPVLNKIVESSGRNLRRAILQLEATRVSAGGLELSPDAEIMRGDWEYACANVALSLTRGQSAAQLMKNRKTLQELLAHAVPPDVVLRRIVEEILRIADDEICPEICRVAARFDQNLTNGAKPIFHLEAFAARFMQIYAKFLGEQAAMIE